MSALPITDRWTWDVTERLFGSPMAADVLLARWNAPDLGGFDVALAWSRDEHGEAA